MFLQSCYYCCTGYSHGSSSVYFTWYLGGRYDSIAALGCVLSKEHVKERDGTRLLVVVCSVPMYKSVFG